MFPKAHMADGMFPKPAGLTLCVAAWKEPIEDMLEMILFLMRLDKPFYLTHWGTSITFYNLLYVLSYFQGQPAVVQFSTGATLDVTNTTTTSAAPLHLNSCQCKSKVKHSTWCCVLLKWKCHHLNKTATPVASVLNIMRTKSKITKFK